MTYVSLLSALIGLGLAPAAGAPSRPPDACKLVTVADVNRVMGGGYVQNAAGRLGNSDDVTGCLYQNNRANTASITVLNSPNDDARGAVLDRQNRQRQAGRTVFTLDEVCDVAFAVAITPSNTTLIAARGPWQLDFKVIVEGLPHIAAEEALARVACARIR